MDEHPKIRQIEVFPIQYDGNRHFCLRDPQRITDQTLFISELAFYFLTMMNGGNTVVDMQADYTRRFGDILPREQIEELVGQLDEFFMLDNERFRERLEAAKREFETCASRPCSHAGISYPAEPDELEKKLNDWYAAAATLVDDKIEPDAVAGVMAPHIDIERGGPCFAAAYGMLRDKKPDLFVILGVAHAPCRNMFTVVPMDFETPFGPLPVDREGVELIKSKLGDGAVADGFELRHEHSIEFQTVFLKHILGGQSVPILPVMCSSFHEIMETGGSPEDDDTVTGLIEAIRERADGLDVCYIAGVDLAHVGPRFGDPVPPGGSMREHIRRADLEMLAHAEAMDAEGFYRSVADVRDERRICGFPAMYVFLKLMPAKRGRVVRYEQLMDEQTGSLVSFASLVFTGDSG